MRESVVQLPFVDIFESTRIFEQWMAAQGEVDREALDRKHALMAEGAFPFLRATYYYWTVAFAQECPDLAAASLCPSVGDTHLENFGTWRDSEGRLVWGINDYDEAALLPWTNDPVRLATSILLAVQDGRLDLKPRTVCEALLSGYAQGWEKPRVFVLAEKNRWLRDIARRQIKDPDRFFERMESLEDAAPPPRVVEVLSGVLPPGFRVKRRTAGAGSLGRQRYAAISEWNGASIVREVKFTGPVSQSCFGNTVPGLRAEIYSQRIQSPDPFLIFHPDCTIRRLAPDCTKIEISLIQKAADQIRVVSAMGTELAAVHRIESSGKIPSDLRRRPSSWLYDAACQMADAVTGAQKIWRKKWKSLS